jgi:hypothetical protein
MKEADPMVECGLTGTLTKNLGSQCNTAPGIPGRERRKGPE